MDNNVPLSDSIVFLQCSDMTYLIFTGMLVVFSFGSFGSFGHFNQFFSSIFVSAHHVLLRSECLCKILWLVFPQTSTRSMVQMVAPATLLTACVPTFLRRRGCLCSQGTCCCCCSLLLLLFENRRDVPKKTLWSDNTNVLECYRHAKQKSISNLSKIRVLKLACYSCYPNGLILSDSTSLYLDSSPSRFAVSRVCD
jgi:hypothetical protein